MLHLLFWGTLAIGITLILWAVIGNKSYTILDTKPLYIAIIFFLLNGSCAIFFAIEIYKKVAH